MASTEKEHHSIEFGEIYLSDLNSVVSFYRNQKSAQTGHNQKIEIATDFGLPLGIAKLGKKVIAYSFATINSAGKAIVEIQVDPEFETKKEVKEPLISFASRKFADNWTQDVNGSSPEKQVKHAIIRMVDWLNLSY